MTLPRLRAFACQLVCAGGVWLSGGVALAQSPPPNPAPLPNNVAVSGRMYVVEGIVVVVLFAGAVFAVCRTSGRT